MTSLLRRLVIVAALASLLAPAAAHARAGESLIFDAPRELTSTDPATRAAALDELQQLGVDRVRLIVTWDKVAPDADASAVPTGFDERSPAGYNWGAYDAAVREAAARGLRPLVVLSGPVPRWAASGHQDHVSDPSTTRFERFAEAAGRQWGPLVDTWSIWNEPNHPDFLGPQFRNGKPASPGIYRHLLQAGQRGLKLAGQGSDRVLAGETAPRGTAHVVAPIDFVQGTFCLDAKWHRRSGCGALDIDGWAHHPYTTAAGPWFVPAESTDVTIGVLSRLQRALDRAAAAHAVKPGLSIWLTEFGVQSVPDPFVGVSEQSQSEFRAIAESIAWANPRVAAFGQYLLRDDLPRAGSERERYSGFESGLRHSDGTPKLAYAAFPTPIAASRTGHSSTTRLWGVVRAAGTGTATIQYRTGSGAWRPLKAVRTDRYGGWSTTTSYASTRRYRVRPSGAHGAITDAAGVRARTR